MRRGMGCVGADGRVLCVWTPLCMVFLGCGDPAMIPAEGGGAVDAAVAPLDPHACVPESTETDFWNCGACEHSCLPATSDRCVRGECWCGLSPGCAAGEGCRAGRCVPSDPEGTTCEFDDECFRGDVCIEGRCSFLECVPEVCDGADNDCDGFVDGSAASPLVERCFSGPEGEIIAPCQSGYRICNGGEWSACMDEVAPIPERGLLGCDGLDNDCDGCRDGSYDSGTGLCLSAEPRTFDIVFIVDISGSMADEILAVKTATASFSETFSTNPAFRFALLAIPGESERLADVRIDLSGFTEFNTELTALRTGRGAFEPSYDVVHDLATDGMGLAFRDDSARIIVLFTDEPGQSSQEPRITESSMCAAMTGGEVLAVVTSPGLFQDFDECALLMELTSSSEEMVENLETIISNPCN